MKAAQIRSVRGLGCVVGAGRWTWGLGMPWGLQHEDLQHRSRKLVLIPGATQVSALERPPRGSTQAVAGSREWC